MHQGDRLCKSILAKKMPEGRGEKEELSFFLSIGMNIGEKHSLCFHKAHLIGIVMTMEKFLLFRFL